MGHATDYIVVDKKKDILPAAESFAFYNVDRYENPSGSYHNRLDILEQTIYEDYGEAYDKAVELERERGSYNDFAIPFHDSIKQEPTKQMLSLERRLKKLSAGRSSYEEKHSVKNLSSKLITCKKCESKIAKSFLRNNSCPVCGKDLRSDYILERIKKYHIDYTELSRELSQLERKRSKKGPVKWLVKVEVHC